MAANEEEWADFASGSSPMTSAAPAPIGGGNDDFTSGDSQWADFGGIMDTSINHTSSGPASANANTAETAHKNNKNDDNDEWMGFTDPASAADSGPRKAPMASAIPGTGAAGGDKGGEEDEWADFKMSTTPPAQSSLSEMGSGGGGGVGNNGSGGEDEDWAAFSSAPVEAAETSAGAPGHDEWDAFVAAGAGDSQQGICGGWERKLCL